MGGPALNPIMHRSEVLRSNHESAGCSLRYARLAAARRCPTGNISGILPFGGSTISEVRRVPMVVVPRSIQKLL